MLTTAPTAIWPELRGYRAMSSSAFRIVLVAGVVLISLLGVASFAVVLYGELTDRSVILFTAIIGFLGSTIASLLVLLRTDATAVKAEEIHHDLLNGGLRENVKKAFNEIEYDPEIEARRVNRIARGVSQDRHDKANRDTVERNRAQLDELRRQRAAEDEGR